MTDHSYPMAEMLWRQFTPWPSLRHEQHVIQIGFLNRLKRERNMPDMDWVKGAGKDSNSTLQLAHPRNISLACDMPGTRNARAPVQSDSIRRRRRTIPVSAL
jgi:hypothetical protein